MDTRTFTRIEEDTIAGICPVCGEYLEAYSSLEVDPDTNDGVYYKWWCGCGASGKEWYRLDFGGHYDIEIEENPESEVEATIDEKYFNDFIAEKGENAE